ncbi:hypothetical protein [Mesorhizobium sp.]|uniref:hypothetical protein n=1 Tax=Mesorhizobium sp. TaxID=1871066 RepID=UPI000FE6F880|nr:hypothetical protein [Mesorhizobium sp.]RWO22175.1 MAG: hypothetical protein EOS09_21295 [Mesorhizobium sp.]
MRHTIDAVVSAGFASGLSKDISEKIAGCLLGRKRGSKAKSWVEVAGYSSVAAKLGWRIFNTKMKCNALQHACGCQTTPCVKRDGSTIRWAPVKAGMLSVGRQEFAQPFSVMMRVIAGARDRAS